MRNAAAAHFDDDFAIDEPSRKKASRRSSSGKPVSGNRKKKGRSRFRLDVDMQRVARYAAIGMSATVAIGIMVNALIMQKSRHPAPLFAKSFALGEPATKPLPTKAPPPNVEEPREKTALPSPPPPPAETRSASQASESAPARTDAIARLLQGGSIAADRSDSKNVLDAQRALVKLGFALKPTGTFGPQTRKAIERFEKDHHLPVKGELSRRLVKALAAESGMKIEH